jgi:excisionase family DNA binding protein
METTTPTKLLLTTEEAASVLGIGRTRMYQLVRTGKVRSVTLGRSRRIRPEDLETYVEQLAGQSDLGEEVTV